MKTKGAFLLIITVIFLMAGPALACQYTNLDSGSFGEDLSILKYNKNSVNKIGLSHRENRRTVGAVYSNNDTLKTRRIPRGENLQADRQARKHAVAEKIRKEDRQGRAFKRKDSVSAEDSIMAGNGFFTDGCTGPDACEVPGFSDMQNITSQAFLYDGQSLLDLGTLGGESSYAYGINDLGQVVGSFMTAQGEMHAFLYDESGMHDLNDLFEDLSGWDYLMAAYDINNNGEIVGIGMTNGQQHGFLLSASETIATPLPGSILLFASGFLPFMLIRRRFAKNDISL